MIIVTGGAGFIGSNIVAALERAGKKDIVVIDTLGNGDKWKNLAKRELAAIVDPVDTDAFLHKNREDITAVIHMGAISATTETDVDLIIRSNFTLSWKLWEFCRDNGISFIYASSAATYGDGSIGFDDESTLAHLKMLRPLNPYGWSKSLFDLKIAREIAEKRPAPPQYAGLKFFNVYGPNEYHKGGQKSVVAHIFPQVRDDKAVQLFKSYHPDYADGWQLRDFVWVGDCADIVLWLIDHPEVNGLFNVGTGEARSFHDLARATFEALGKTANITYKDMPGELRGKYQYFTEASLTRLREAGYSRQMTSLEKGIATYVNDFLNKEDQYL